MNEEIQTHHFEYLSLLLVLSFLIIHKIYIVIIGISLAIYIINKKSLYSFINNFIYSHKDKIPKEYKIKKDIPIKLETTRQRSNKETKLISLAEIIEESGFIPSLDKEDNRNAA